MERKNYLATTSTGRYITTLNEVEVNAINEGLDIWIEIQKEKFVKSYEIHYINLIEEITEKNMFDFKINNFEDGLVTDNTVIFDGSMSEGIDSDELVEIIINNNYVYYYNDETNITLDMAKEKYLNDNNVLFDLTYIAQNGEQSSKINLSMLELIKELYRLDINNIARYGYVSIFDTTDRKVLK